MLRQYRKPDKGEPIIVYADTAVGGTDYCAVQFFSRSKLDYFMVYHARVVGTEMTNSIFPYLERLFDITGVKPVVAYERNNGGAFEMDRLAALNRLGKFELYRMPTAGRIEVQAPTKYGVDVNSAVRPVMLGNFKEAVDKRLVGIYDKPTVNELYSFVISTTSSSWKAQAESGAHDDLVMSAAGVWFVYENSIARTLEEDNDLPDDTGWITRI